MDLTLHARPGPVHPVHARQLAVIVSSAPAVYFLGLAVLAQHRPPGVGPRDERAGENLRSAASCARKMQIPTELLASEKVEAGGLRFGWVTLGCCSAHLAWAWLTGLRFEHLLLDGLFLALPWIGPRAERFTRAAFPLWLTALIFDNQRFMKVIGTVHTGDVYRLDALLFPAGYSGHALAWAERLSMHPSVGLDFFCGLAYMLFIAELVLIALYLYVRGEEQAFSAIAWAFLFVNVVGVLTWLFCPVAPPWYILEHGFGPALPNPAPSAAGTARFDALLHIHFFRDFYARNPNIYGAMPSLHCSYPAIAAWYVWRRGAGWRVPTLVFAAFMGFSAVYLAHHYVVDVIAGYATAVLSCALSDWILRRQRSRRAVRAYKPHPVNS